MLKCLMIEMKKLIFWGSLLLVGGLSSSFAEVRVLAERGQAVPPAEVAAHAWPAEILELMALNSREVVWKNPDNGKFSHNTTIAFRPANQAQVDQIISIFAKTKRDYHRFVLQPEAGPLRNARRYPASFQGCSLYLSVGSPKMLQAWYEALPVNEDGLHYSPYQVFTEPPQSGDHSLMIFAGNKAIDLDATSWPKFTVLISGTSKETRKKKPNDPIILAVDKFASKYSLPTCLERRKRRALEKSLGVQ